MVLTNPKMLPYVDIQHSFVVCTVDKPGSNLVLLMDCVNGVFMVLRPSEATPFMPGLWFLNLETFMYISFGFHTQSLS